MPGYSYKHYIRTNSAGEAVYGFSDAFEQPQPGDILLCETPERHFGADPRYPDLLPLPGPGARPRWRRQGKAIAPVGSQS